MASPPLPAPVAQALGRGATVLTGSQRAARTLRRAFDASAQQQGKALWTPPKIFAVDTWLAGLWHAALLDGTEHRTLLNRVQEQRLWREAIRSDPEAPALRSPDALASQATRAYRLLHLHNGRDRLQGAVASADSRAFLRWTRTVERRSRAGGFLTDGELPTALRQACAEGRLPLPDAGLLLVDFDTITPALDSFFEAMDRAGYAVERLRTSAATTEAQRHGAADDSAELRAAALWACGQLERNPQARIAIVVPNLADRRAEMDRIFAELLAPEQAHVAASPAALPYEFSLGRPLAQTALASAAMHLLRWAADPLPLATVRTLLLSPFFGAAAGPESAEASAAARFDAFALARLPLLRPELSLRELLTVVRHQPAAPASLAERLQAMLHVVSSERLQPDAAPGAIPSRRSFASWSECFRRLLDAAGWSRPATSDSLTAQTFRSWDSALDQLSTLDLLAGEPTFLDALDALALQLDETVFAPGSRGAPVQILGPLEVGGGPVDALWFLGADDLSWPAPAQPQPLLPFALQRELGMPGTDPARDRAAAHALTYRLAHAAAKTVFSYAELAEDGERRPSPVVRNVLRELSATVLPPAAPVPDHVPLVRERVPDDTALPLLSGPVHGGARVLELQAACPFRAMAELRLHASEPGLRALGLDAMESGSIVHDIMDDFWQELGDQAALRTLDPAERATQLRLSIDFALSKATQNAAGPWDDAYLEMQRERLQRLLEPWLERELQRPPFTVMSLEEERPWVPVGPLELRLRIDRIDRVATPDRSAQGIVLIDYKTGQAEPRQWLGERPDAPQLPLYAVLPEAANLLGVAFAQLRAGKGMDLKGFADDPALFGRKPTQRGTSMEAEDFPGQVERWREIVTRLSTEFAQGEAAVQPKSYPQTCRHCGQRALCRLNPTQLEEWCDEGEPADSGDGAPGEADAVPAGGRHG